LAVFSGCNKESYIKTEYVKGKVIWKGEALTGAFVTFYPKAADGVAASGETNDQGDFELYAVGGKPSAGAVAGDYIVTVSKSSNESQEVPDPNSSGGVRIIGISKLLTPKEFSDKNTSPLTATVNPGKNEGITIDLDKK
jgi:hypothetical protein